MRVQPVHFLRCSNSVLDRLESIPGEQAISDISQKIVCRGEKLYTRVGKGDSRYTLVSVPSILPKCTPSRAYGEKDFSSWMSTMRRG